MVTARINSGFSWANQRAQYAPNEKPMVPSALPVTAGCLLNSSKADRTKGGISSVSFNWEVSCSACSIVRATFPENRSGARTTNPSRASRSQKSRKKSFNPHQACSTSTPAPLPDWGTATYRLFGCWVTSISAPKHQGLPNVTAGDAHADPFFLREGLSLRAQFTDALEDFIAGHLQRLGACRAIPFHTECRDSRDIQLVFLFDNRCELQRRFRERLIQGSVGHRVGCSIFATWDLGHGVARKSP